MGCLQHRGEYLYAAVGKEGFRVYDIAGIGNKGISQRIISTPISPLGHDSHIDTKNATCVALATTQPVHPARNQGSLMRETNQERAFFPIYNYAVITDSEEGLILTDINTLSDGEPRNNFLERALTWNPGGVLTGARHVILGGYVAYIMAARGLVIVSLEEPLAPRMLAVLPLEDARSSVLQFRYLFVVDATGLNVVDVTEPAAPRLIPDNLIPLADARRVFVARTFAYVAAGEQGLAIVDVERPEAMRLHQLYDAELKDARDVVVATTNASLFAYVADGSDGLKVLQLTSPRSQPGFYGFSPEPRPEVIARRATRRPALALSRGLERDRAVDETGGQVAVFGRLGSGPLSLEDMRRLYLNEDGSTWTVKREQGNDARAK